MQFVYQMTKPFFYSLLSPQDLYLYLPEYTKKIEITFRFLISFFIAGGYLLLHTSFHYIHLYRFMILVAAIYFALKFFSELMAKFLIYSLMNSQNVSYPPEKVAQIYKDTGKIIELAYSPFIFILHVGVFSRYVNMPLVFVAGKLILAVWFVYLVSRSLEFVLEIPAKNITKLLLKNLVLIYFYPVFFILLPVIFLVF